MESKVKVDIPGTWDRSIKERSGHNLVSLFCSCCHIKSVFVAWSVGDSKSFSQININQFTLYILCKSYDVPRKNKF